LAATKVRVCNAYFGVGTYVADGSGGEVVTVEEGLEVNSNKQLASWANGASGSIYKNYTFGGQLSVVIPGGQCAESGPLWSPLAAGQALYTHSTCNEPIAKTCPATTIGNSLGKSLMAITQADSY
jgi:hypothetical protein